jgi:hypothetical protein
VVQTAGLFLPTAHSRRFPSPLPPFSISPSLLPHTYTAQRTTSLLLSSSLQCSNLHSLFFCNIFLLDNNVFAMFKRLLCDCRPFSNFSRLLIFVRVIPNRTSRACLLVHCASACMSSHIQCLYSKYVIPQCVSTAFMSSRSVSQQRASNPTLCLHSVHVIHAKLYVSLQVHV